MKSSVKSLFVGMALCLVIGIVHAADVLLPFSLAYKTNGDITKVVNDVKQKLTGAGFEIAGSYSPYETATILAITNDDLKQAAAKTPFGGYGAAQRVTITKVGNEIQVAYTNPVYMANAYRMNADLSGVQSKLKTALGWTQDYGPAAGKSAEELHKYHYMIGMEYFDDPSDLAKYDSHDDAVKAVEQGLAAGKGGTSKVYRIDIPGGKETVFGVALTNGCSSDKFIMNEIDFKPLRSTGHLPYEILVSDNKVYALYARFRIAMNFPDLKMMGSNSFVNIMCAPNAIESALTAAAGGTI
jgi:hypothetical protein